MVGGKPDRVILGGYLGTLGTRVYENFCWVVGEVGQACLKVPQGYACGHLKGTLGHPYRGPPYTLGQCTRGQGMSGVVSSVAER